MSEPSNSDETDLKSTTAYKLGWKKGIAYGFSKALKAFRKARHTDITPEEPFFIFTQPYVFWNTLTPYLNRVYSQELQKIIEGTFPTVGCYEGSDLTGVECDNEKISFPHVGEYYLHTNIGFFKILILDSQAKEDDKILSIARFVACNIVSGTADHERIYSSDKYVNTCGVGNIFFASDQPLKFHCLGTAHFLRIILKRADYRVQIVNLLGRNGSQQHVVTEVFLSNQQKFAMIDANYGVIVRDQTKNILSVQEIILLLKEKPDDLHVEDIGNGKKEPLLKFNRHVVDSAPDYAWYPERMGTNKINENYLEKFALYTTDGFMIDPKG